MPFFLSVNWYQCISNRKQNKRFIVFLVRIDGHAVLVNNKFLQMAETVLKPFQNTAYYEFKGGAPTGI